MERTCSSSAATEIKAGQGQKEQGFGEEEAQQQQQCTEPVLLVPPKLTKHAYAVLLSAECVPRGFHHSGRFGSRTHVAQEQPEKKIGIPLIPCSLVDQMEAFLAQPSQQNLDQQMPPSLLLDQPALQQLLQTAGLKIEHRVPVQSNRVPKVEVIDATTHPERAPSCKQEYHCCSCEVKHSSELKNPSFTFAELFAGIGGFGVALEKLGGRCVFASEISEPCRQVYSDNLDTSHLRNSEIAGDIWEINNDDVPDHDILVAGFPCQPFSTLGDQPGLADDKRTSIWTSSGSAAKGAAAAPTSGPRGLLYTQIVRILKAKKPRAFLLENVPGLISTDGGRALAKIESDLVDSGYQVYHEVISSRGLTTQSRKRLYFVGFLHQTELDHHEVSAPTKPFEFPFIPDLGLRAGDILCSEEELGTLKAWTLPDRKDCRQENQNGPSKIGCKRPHPDTAATDMPDCGEDSDRSIAEGDGGCGGDKDSGRCNAKGDGGGGGGGGGGGDSGEDGGAGDPPGSLLDLLRVTPAQLAQLLSRPKIWRPCKLAWPDKVLDTLDSHYGASVGKGGCQLVPGARAPLRPRRMAPRELARAMGFGEQFRLGGGGGGGGGGAPAPHPPPRAPNRGGGTLPGGKQKGARVEVGGSRDWAPGPGQGAAGYLKQRYRMLGNAVCPPVVAVLAGAILEQISRHNSIGLPLLLCANHSNIDGKPNNSMMITTDGGGNKGEGSSSQQIQQTQQLPGGAYACQSSGSCCWINLGLQTALRMSLGAVPAGTRRERVKERVHYYNTLVVD